MVDAPRSEALVNLNMKKLGFNDLTKIQKKAIPVIIRKKDCLLVAPTGSGKTEAAVIPVLTDISTKKDIPKGVKLLYITPLKSLNRDIFRRIIIYAETLGLKADVRHGDTPSSSRTKMVKNPPDILITTPETFAILLVSPKMKFNLKSVEWVIVDELHELLGNERGVHLTISLERLVNFIGHPVTRIGLSATLGNLRAAGNFLVGSGKKCAILVGSEHRKYDIICNYVNGPVLKLTKELMTHLRNIGIIGTSVIIFTNTRVEAEYISAAMKAEAPELDILVHHGSLSKEIREEAEEKLKSAESSIVISTSSLELGLDIGEVDLVVQIGSPRQAIKLIQRIGRSRHQIGRTAKGFIFTNKIDDEIEGKALIRRISEESLEECDIHFSALDVLAHHISGMVLESRNVSVSQIQSIITRAYPFKDVSIAETDSCLELLKAQNIIWYRDGLVRKRGLTTLEYYYQNISTIPDILQFDVFDVSSNKRVGRLDQVFVGEYGEPGKPFTLRGAPWKIVSVDDDAKCVNVEPLPKEMAVVPKWVGELIPVDFETAQIVGKMRREVIHGSKEYSSELTNALIKTKDLLGIIPDEQNIIIEMRKGTSTVVIHSCLGTKVNQTISTLLSTLISSKTGFLVEARCDPYRILLSSQGLISPSHITESLQDSHGLEDILTVAVIGTHPLNWKTWNVAKKFGVIARGAQYNRRTARLIQERYRTTPLYKEVQRELFLEKYDVEKTKQVISEIQKNVIRQKTVSTLNFSPLAKPILNFASSFSAMPHSLDQTVFELVKERLLKTKQKIICLSCGKWERIVKTNEIPTKIVCGLCKSKIISTTYRTDEDASKIIIKMKKGYKLSKDENIKLRKLWKTASLIQNFGKMTFIAFAGHGVGPDTAGRLLRNYLDEEKLVKDIYRAEKNYISTRGFWDT